VFGILKDHIDRFVFEDNFLHGDHVLVADLPVQLRSSVGRPLRCVMMRTYCDFSYGTLADPGIGDNVALFVGFELFYRVDAVGAVLADGFVHAAIRS